MKNLQESIEKSEWISHFVGYDEFKNIKNMMEDLHFCSMNPYSSEDLLCDTLEGIAARYDELLKKDPAVFYDEESRDLILETYSKMVNYARDLLHGIRFNTL